MKKILFVLFMTLICLFGNSVFASESLPSSMHQKIGIIILGDADFKTDDYFNNIKNAFNDPKTKYFYGIDAQSKYEEYWLNKGVITKEPNPTVQDLYQFTTYSNCDKVLYLVVQSCVVEKQALSKGLFGSGGGERNRANIEVKGILVDQSKIIKVVDSVKDDTSETSELRAKREAFGKNCKDISQQLQSVL